MDVGSSSSSSSSSGEIFTYRPSSSDGEKHLKRMELSIKIFAVVSLILFGLTILFIGLAAADKMHPIASMATLGGTLALGVICKIIDCCQQATAKKHQIDFKAWQEAQRPPPKSKKKKEKK